MADKPRCSFCKRPPNEVKSLIAGPDEGVFICDRCAAKANDTVQGQATRVSKEEKPLQPPHEIKKYLDEYVIGQESTKRALAVAVYNHYKRREAIRAKIDLGGVELKKSNILLPGPSGTGKTETARAIARMLGVPFHIGDASRLTQAGYVGDDTETLIQGLMENADHDVERAEWGIVFLDEFDKIARKSGRDGMGYRDIGGEGVQQALLKLVEGSKVAVPRGMGQKMMAMGMQATDIIDTENVLFVCAGSFDGIQEVVKKRLNKGSSLGFGAAARKVDLSLTEVYSNVTEDDILEFGIIPELLGRLPVLTSTLPLTEDEMLRILTEPKNALIKQMKALFKLDGVTLDFDDNGLRGISQEAMRRPTGARALRSILEALLQNYCYDLPSDDTVIGLRITEEYVKAMFPGEKGEPNSDVKPILIEGKKKVPKILAHA